MEKATFDKANDILQKISKINKALNAFEREETDELGSIVEKVDLKPTLIIEHLNEDYCGRKQTEMPMTLNIDFILLLKSYLQKEKEILEKQFELL